MKTIRRLLVVLVVMAAGTGFRVAAQESAPAQASGRVLLLQSERGLEGEIEKFGEQYRVRRGMSEVWLPAEKVVRLCVDWEDAYAFMKTRANLGDPDERLRLARWCQLNNLRAQALIEAKLALEMRSKHEPSRQLVAILTRDVASLGGTPAKTPRVVPGKIVLAPSSCDISADSFALFATRVQPILMNTCVICHSGGRGGDFQLLRTEGGQRGSTQANLAAILAQVNVDNPVLSPLLIKAVSRHGNAANAPINDRQSIPFKTLQAWIDHLLANNPHLRHQEAPASASAARTTPEPVAFAQTQGLPPLRARPLPVSRPMARPELPKETAKPAAPPAGATPLQGAPTLETPPSSAPVAANNDEAQTAQVNALDPFDPAIFNRQMHPRK